MPSRPVVEGGDAKRPLGVFEYVVEKAQGSQGEVAGAIEPALQAAGWQVLARVDASAPSGCGFKASVLAVVERGYAARMMATNRTTAPFARVDRVNVFQDEAGVHVAVINVESVNRTILMDDRAHADLNRAHLNELRLLLEGAVRGTASVREFGEARTEGLIGKTMGVMAGGPFGGKVEDVVVVPGGDWKGETVKVRLVDAMYRMKLYFEDAGKWAFMNRTPLSDPGPHSLGGLRAGGVERAIRDTRA